MANKFSAAPPRPSTPEEFMDQAPMQPRSEQSAPIVTLAAGTSEDRSVYRTLTLRLNRERYKALKMMSTVSETPIQGLLEEALDDFLVKKGPSVP